MNDLTNTAFQSKADHREQDTRHAFLLLWPWPWPEDSSERVLAYQNWTF